MESLVTSAGQYGAMGLTLLASFWFINKLNEDQKAERKDVADRLEQMHRDALDAINNNTSVLSAIKNVMGNK